LGLESLRTVARHGGADRARISASANPGTLWAFDTDAELAEAENWLEHARAVADRYAACWIRPVRPSVINGSVAPAFAGALHTPSDGVAEPEKAVPAMARAAQAAGCGDSLATGAVRGLDLRAGPRLPEW